MPRKKHWSERKFREKRAPANQVPDPLMEMLREKGTYVKPAEKEKKQFKNTIFSEGPWRYIDEEIAMLVFGAADEYTMQGADNVADWLSSLVNYGNEKIKGRELAPKEEAKWGEAIRNFRKEFGHEYEDMDQLGRNIANFIGIFTPKAWAQGLFGLAGSLFHKHGFKKGVKFLKEFGDKTARAARAGKALDKAEVKNIWTTVGEGLEKVPGSPIFQAARTGAEAGTFNVLAEDDIEKWNDLSVGLSALAGGSLHALAKSGKRATELLPRAEKELKERAGEISGRLGLTEKTKKRIQQARRSFTKNPKDSIKNFKSYIEDLYSNSYAFRDQAIDALNSNKFNIPVSKIAIPIKGQIKSIVLPNLSKGERWIFMSLLDQDFNREKAVRSLENFMTKKMKGKNRARFRALLSSQQVEEGVNNVLAKYQALIKDNPNKAQAAVLSELEGYRKTLSESPLFQKKVKNPKYDPNGVGDQLDKELRVASEYQVRNIVNGLNQKADFNKDLLPGTNSEFMARFGQARHDVNEYLKRKNPVFGELITKSSNIKEVLEGAPRKKTRGLFDLFEITPLGRSRGDSPGFAPVLEYEERRLPNFMGSVSIQNPDNTEAVLREVIFGGDRATSEASKAFRKAVNLFDPAASDARYRRMAKNVEKGMLAEALQDPKAAQSILKELQDEAFDLSKSILKKEELNESLYSEALKGLKNALLWFGGGYTGAQFGVSDQYVKAAIGIGVWNSLNKIKKLQDTAAARNFFKGGDAYEGLKDVMLLEDQLKDLQKAYRSGNWSQVNSALRTWGVGERLIDKISRKAAKARDFVESVSGPKGDFLRAGVEGLGRATRVTPIQRTIKGEELREKRAEQVEIDEASDVLDAFGSTPYDDVSDDLKREPQGVDMFSEQETIFSPKKEELDPGEFLDRSQSLEMEEQEPPQIEAFDPEEFPSPEPARGIFEPEEIQSPEAKDRELRSSRINSFLKQQGAYKRSRRRRQAIG